MPDPKRPALKMLIVILLGLVASIVSALIWCRIGVIP